MTALPCPPELWPRLSPLLDEALDLTESGRSAWLAALPTHAAALRPWLEKLLGAAPWTGFSGPRLKGAGVSGFTSGQTLGGHVLEAPLGTGGMGEVWLAQPVAGRLKRRVALKLPHAFLLAGTTRARFERERDILASLSHPHIAQLHEAGVDGDHPWLAMEFVEGEPLNVFCQRLGLDLPARIALFLQVLEAVEYAHQRFVAHRDLKPSNILVTADGQVKLLDFGIAKLLGEQGTAEATELTRLGGNVATPEYAAPEQLLNGTVTAASDVYALGVVLYELLAGQRPFANARGTGAATLRGEAPRLASRLVDGAAHRVGTLAPRQLRRALDGDLDAIAAKALEPDPQRRYRSAAAFADDLERHLRIEPISARPLGSLARLWRAAQRHRAQAVLGAALMLAVLVGIGGVAWQAVRAERQAQRATAIKDYLVGVFQASDPRVASERPRGSITARELLERTAARINGEFAGDVETQLELLALVAKILDDLGEHQRFETLNDDYLALALRTYGEDSTPYLSGLLDRTNHAIWYGDLDDGRRLLAAIDASLRARGDGDPVLRGRWWWLTGLERDRTPAAKLVESEVAYRHAVEQLPASRPEHPRALMRVAEITEVHGDRDGAIRGLQQVVAEAEAMRPRNDVFLANANGSLGLRLTHIGRFAEAEAPLARAVDLAERSGGIDTATLLPMLWYAGLLHRNGKRREAIRVFERLWQVIPVAPADPAQAGAYHFARARYGYCLLAEGRPAKALPLLETGEAWFQHHDWAHIVVLPFVRATLGTAYAQSGRNADARRTLLLAVDEGRRTLPTGDSDRQDALDRRARFHLDQGEAAAAERDFLELQSLATGEQAYMQVYVEDGLARVALHRQDRTTALAHSEQALRRLETSVNLGDIRLEPQVWQTHAEALLAAGRPADALPWVRKAVSAREIYDDAASPALGEARRLLARAEARP